jgi:response regulator of citrate/malate metabolism
MATDTFALAVKAGKVQHLIKPIPFRKTVKTRLYSWFKYGFNALNQAISCGKLALKKFLKIVLHLYHLPKTVQ